MDHTFTFISMSITRAVVASISKLSNLALRSLPTGSDRQIQRQLSTASFIFNDGSCNSNAPCADDGPVAALVSISQTEVSVRSFCRYVID